MELLGSLEFGAWSFSSSCLPYFARVFCSIRGHDVAGIDDAGGPCGKFAVIDIAMRGRNQDNVKAADDAGICIVGRAAASRV